MSRRKNPIPSVLLNVALPMDVHTRLSAMLYSDLEGRVPLGAYKEYFTRLLREQMDGRTLDLAPFLGTPSGAFTVTGSAEAINALELHLKEK